MLKKIIISSLCVSVILIAYFSTDINRTLNTATGFAAKNLCSGHYNSGYPLDQFMAEALVPVNPAFRLVRYEHDEEKQQIRTRILGLKQRIAQYREGIGCTLLGVGQLQLSGHIETPTPGLADNTLPWPDGLAKPIYKETVNYQKLTEALDYAFAETEESGLKQTKAVLVVHQGDLIIERYAAPIERNTPSLSWSMAKSITNLLIATLVRNDRLDIHAPVAIASWQIDARKEITVDHLLRMSSGLKFNETYGINTDVTYMLSNAISASDYAIQSRLDYPIDTNWSYSSGTSNILARIAFDAIGGDLQAKYDYVQKYLFNPLGITSALMETDGSNVFIGSSYFYASPLDYAKLGQLLLQNGYWKDQQLLPDGWVEYSTRPTPTAPNREYGAQFWLNLRSDSDSYTPPWPDAPEDAFYMGGYQGQYIIIIPSEELVVVRLGYTHPGTDDGINDLLAGVISALGN